MYTVVEYIYNNSWFNNTNDKNTTGLPSASQGALCKLHQCPGESISGHYDACTPILDRPEKSENEMKKIVLEQNAFSEKNSFCKEKLQKSFL